MNLPPFLATPLSCGFFLFSFLSLTCVSCSLSLSGKVRAKNLLQKAHFFSLPLFQRLFPQKESLAIFEMIHWSQALSLLFYAFTGVAFLDRVFGLSFFGSLAILFVVCFLLELLLRTITQIWSQPVLKITAPICSLLFWIFSPFLFIPLQIARFSMREKGKEEEDSQGVPSRAHLRELIRDSELKHHLDRYDQKLISSFVHFKERVAKEVMVPRVDIFSLPAQMSIRNAAALFVQEEYSRIPVYRETLDDIAGVVLYKDLLRFYTSSKNAHSLDAHLETIIKPVLYAPESKKIAHLLQEFRKKQIHMAIIVDEYGGTEGVVTIEDILEELVGEIEDEYDVDTDQLFWALPNGGWIVDAKMSILDIEEHLGISIPSHSDYETIGGYVFHRAGTIPAKGWRSLQDQFELEVLTSNERSIKKIKITPSSPPPSS